MLKKLLHVFMNQGNYPDYCQPFIKIFSELLNDNKKHGDFSQGCRKLSKKHKSLSNVFLLTFMYNSHYNFLVAVHA